MRYRFHPLAGENLSVVRLHYVHDEPCYVIRRPDGSTVSVPAWMTELSASDVQLVERPRVPLVTLLELRRWTSTFLSSRACTSPTGERDAATPNGSAQTVLFDDAEAHPLAQLPQEGQIQLLQQMVQWMQAVAAAINKGERDEQNHR